MPTLYFLEANVPLVKGYTLNDQNEIKATSYPNVAKFKSHKANCPTLKDFYTQLVDHAKAGHCLLKGKLNRVLNWESRAGSTNSNDTTDYLCFDLDGAPFKDPEHFMSGHPLLKDVGYIVQYSASQGLGKPGLRCHIFVLLNTQYNVSYLKSWLMELNLDGNLWAGAVRKSITLSPSRAALHWPIDVTACQNDKLLYIAPPVIGKGVSYKPPSPTIQIVGKKNLTLDTSLLNAQNIELWKKEQRALLNALRKEAGLETVRPTRMVGEYEVQGKPGEANITEIWEDGDFVRFNLNGGNSNAYYHPIENFEIIHNFKGEPACLTKELLPGYYKDCVARARREATQPTDKGEIILGVCDKRSGALWKISWNATQQALQLYPAKSDKQLADWLMQHGKIPGDFTPQWTFEFNPLNTTVVDTETQYLNTYVPSKYYKSHKPTKTPRPNADNWPTIRKVIASVVSDNEWNEVTEHFLNWLAVAFQHKIKIGTTWLLAGTEGTGKNLLSNHILRPLLGNKYVKEVLVTGLEDQFNGWLEHTLMCFVNEIQVSSSQHRKIISGKLRNWICDSPLDIRNMGQTRYDADNFCNFIMNTNFRDGVDINKADRRYNMGEWQDTRLQMTQHEVTTLIPRELEHFFNYLMSRKACIDTAHKIIDTQSRQDVIDAGRNSVDMLADALLDGDLSPFVEALPDMRLIMEISGQNSALAVAYDTIIKRELALLTSARCIKGSTVITVESRLSRDELFILFDYCIGTMPSSPNKFTRLLKHKGITTKKLRNAHGDLCYGLEVKWTASQAWCAEHHINTQPIRRVK